MTLNPDPMAPGAPIVDIDRTTIDASLWIALLATDKGFDRSTLTDQLVRIAIATDETFDPDFDLAITDEVDSFRCTNLDPDRPGVEDLIDQITAGVRSSFTYAGARSIADFAERATVGIQSSAGYDEGRPLHASW